MDRAIAARAKVCMSEVEEFDTSLPAIAGLADDFFADIVNDYVSSGGGVPGSIGDAALLAVGAAGDLLL